MCLAVKYGNVLIETINKMKEDYESLIALQSEYDKKVSNIYHDIETNNFNASVGFKKYKELQKVLRERRVIKHELAKIQRLHQSLSATQMESKISKIVKNVGRIDDENESYRDGWGIRVEEILI